MHSCRFDLQSLRYFDVGKCCPFFAIVNVLEMCFLCHFVLASGIALHSFHICQLRLQVPANCIAYCTHPKPRPGKPPVPIYPYIYIYIRISYIYYVSYIIYIYTFIIIYTLLSTGRSENRGVRNITNGFVCVYVCLCAGEN